MEPSGSFHRADRAPHITAVCAVTACTARGGPRRKGGSQGWAAPGTASSLSAPFSSHGSPASPGELGTQPVIDAVSSHRPVFSGQQREERCPPERLRPAPHTFRGSWALPFPPGSQAARTPPGSPKVKSPPHRGSPIASPARLAGILHCADEQGTKCWWEILCNSEGLL